MLQVSLFTLHIYNKNISSAYNFTSFILHRNLYYPEIQVNTNIINDI